MIERGHPRAELNLCFGRSTPWIFNSMPLS